MLRTNKPSFTNSLCYPFSSFEVSCCCHCRFFFGLLKSHHSLVSRMSPKGELVRWWIFGQQQQPSGKEEVCGDVWSENSQGFLSQSEVNHSSSVGGGGCGVPRDSKGSSRDAGKAFNFRNIPAPFRSQFECFGNGSAFRFRMDEAGWCRKRLFSSCAEAHKVKIGNQHQIKDCFLTHCQAILQLLQPIKGDWSNKRFTLFIFLSALK